MVSGFKGGAKLFNTSSAKLIYRNEMNSITFPKFTAMEFNIFFTLCYFISNHIQKNGGIAVMIKKSENKINDFIQVSYSANVLTSNQK